MRSLPETLTYNDFHWSKLARSRPLPTGREVIFYDYHVLGLGLASSDCRNVTSVLRSVWGCG